MNHEDLKEKDWQLLVGHSTLANQAMLRTIIAYQAEIYSILTQKEYKDVISEMNKRIVEETVIVDEMTNKNIPNYSPIG